MPMSMELERQIISEAAGEITNLWWTRPDQNGHLKKQAVEDIIQKHLWGFTDAETRKPKPKMRSF